MEQICAVVDIQGFYIKGVFYARECAIVNDKVTTCQEFNPGLNWYDLTKREKSHVNYCKRYIHGLNLQPFTKNSPIPKSDELVNYLLSQYKLLATNEKPLFAVKNDRLKNILLDAGILVCDLNETKYQFPPLATLDKMYGGKWTCAFHIKQKNFENHRCAYRKCIQMWQHVKFTCEPSVEVHQFEEVKIV